MPGGLGLDAHRDAECSNAGECDRVKGECTCNPGHTGAACERLSCPVPLKGNVPCSGKGTCLSLQDLGKLHGIDGDPSTRGDGIGPEYGGGPDNGVWDELVTRGCMCDGGYASADCSTMLCPKGPNPFTLNQQQRAISFNVDLNGAAVASGQLQNVYLRFLGTESYGLDIGTLATLTPGGCAEWAATHPFVKSALCRVSVTNTDEYSLALRLEWDNVGTPHNNHFDHDGNPALAEFNCNARAVTSAAVTCSVTDINVLAGALSYAPNGDTGTAMTIEVVSDTTYPNTYKVTVGATTFATQSMSATASTIGALVNARISWNTLWGHTAGAQWTIDGTGAVAPPAMEEHATCGGIGTCDLFNGVCTCPTGVSGQACSTNGGIPAEINDNSAVLGLDADSSTYVGSILELRAKRTANNVFDFITAVEGANQPIMTLSGNGQLRTRTLAADQGASVATGGLFVGGGGATVASGGLTLKDGGAEIRQSALNQDALAVHSQHALFENSILRLSSDRSAADAFNFLVVVADVDGAPVTTTKLKGSGELEILSGPLTVASPEGLRVTGSGGLQVSNGGTTLAGTTIAVQSSLSASALELQATAPTFAGSIASISATRAASSSFKFATITATAGAQSILTHHGDGRMEIHRGGMDVSGGLTIASGGVAVTTGQAAFGAGMAVTAGGATIASGGLVITSGGSTLSETAVANAHTLRSAATALTSTHSVVRVESDTPSTASPNHGLLWAGSRDGANVMTERLKLTANGVLSVSNYLVLNAKRPIVSANSAATTTVTSAQCGAVVLADLGTVAGTVIVNLPTEDGSEPVGCFVSILVTGTAKDLSVRNPGLSGSLYGQLLHSSGGGTALNFRAISTTNFLTSATNQGTALAVTGTANGGDGVAVESARLTLVAFPTRGPNVWMVLDGLGPWNTAAF